MKRDKSLGWRHVEADSLDLGSMNVAIVGGTGGIGRALAHTMTARGAHVVVIGQTFRDAGSRGIEFVKADLSLLSEARRVATDLPAGNLDLVVMTTGVMAGPRREQTAEGLERDLAISYLSRFVIVNEIASRLGKDRPNAGMKPRIFVTGFPGTGQAGAVDDLNTEKKYGRWRAHSNTVAGNEALVLDAARRFPEVDFFGLNPGFVKTNIRGNLFGSNRLLLRTIEWMFGFATISAETYAARMIPLLVSPDLEGHSGAMFNNKAEAILPSPKLMDASYVRALIDASEALILRASKSNTKGAG
ncbi:SDR family NAD(P)-dependent oxidoreductase [Rhizobium multihospitium]|uniref:NAD(P)-dependent dehydrogenase, short-chain alcohol dehydrogenase family n=1 Tax=Rhizobium multihospitium TaxID=410764 RepID=A0A1C3UU57_9HYPH|nr:SDR family NAD(P)-dependent oxidoreductase [Rhizobium multihospitium]SCB18995.1 NAD(P)-dependent dehydrogenase, short-chain alcohol dehydrogenase family [Rhizobium multihospitium]